jgi:hypothetical protein
MKQLVGGTRDGKCGEWWLGGYTIASTERLSQYKRLEKSGNLRIFRSKRGTTPQRSFYERHTRATFVSGSTGAGAEVPLGVGLAFTESPLCKVELALLPLAIVDVPAGPSNERSLRFVIELDVSERESSMPRGRAGAIALLKHNEPGRRIHVRKQ